jgi:hypothetical protein
MKKSICLAAISFLFIQEMMATTTQNFEPCEKTYVDFYKVDLEENIIKVKDEEGVHQTSAIYSDHNGLYYKDYLPSEKLDLVQTDKLIDPFEEIDSILTSNPLISDEIFAQNQGIEKPQARPPASKPSQASWPFCDKTH